LEDNDLLFPFTDSKKFIRSIEGCANKQRDLLTKMDSGAQPGMTIIAPVPRTILRWLFQPCAHPMSFRAETRNPNGQDVCARVFTVFCPLIIQTTSSCGALNSDASPTPLGRYQILESMNNSARKIVGKPRLSKSNAKPAGV
jgi:hypothetical protein